MTTEEQIESLKNELANLEAELRDMELERLMLQNEIDHLEGN